MPLLHAIVVGRTLVGRRVDDTIRRRLAGVATRRGSGGNHRLRDRTALAAGCAETC